MTTRFRSALLIFGVSAVLAGSGCTSIWESNFVPAPGPAHPPLASSVSVQVRDVNWDRLQSALRDIETQVAASDTHPSEWPEERKREAKVTLLRALQVSSDPATIEIIGRSDFRTTTSLRPETSDERALADFGREVGATLVIWSRRLLGKAETIVQEPVTTWSWGSSWDRHAGRWHGDSGTAWVPVVVEADEYAYIAYFLRE